MGGGSTHFGYLLQHIDDIHVNTFDAKLVFHLNMPEWQVVFRGNDINCRTEYNWTVPCIQMRMVLDAVRDVRAQAQVYLQRQVRRIHELVIDLPVSDDARAKRGFFSDILSKITGLATEDELSALTNVLEQVETGIYEASKLWGDGAKSLVAAFRVEQNRLNNVFHILGEYRYEIRQLQYEVMQSRRSRNGQRYLQMLLVKLLSNTTFQMAEVDALYTGIQFLMTSKISHFILPHDTLLAALEEVQRHLDSTQPHMSLCRQDLTFYYTEASFRTFRKDNTLFLVVNAPVTPKAFVHPFRLYEVVKLPLPTPQSNEYYSMLASDIKYVGWSPGSECILRISDGQPMPNGKIWLATDNAVTFLDQSRPSCALALIEGHLSRIKTFCRYNIRKSPYPRQVIRLFGNTFLLTNISTLYLLCSSQNFVEGNYEHTFHLTEIQSIHSFDCHCEKILADEFRIVADLTNCNISANISTIFNIQYAINLAYLTHYFENDELYNLSAQSLLNHTVEIRLPDLAVADRILDQDFAHEADAAFDMEMIIKNTKQSSVVHDNLAHFLFNQLVRAHNNQNSFDNL